MFVAKGNSSAPNVFGVIAELQKQEVVNSAWSLSTRNNREPERGLITHERKYSKPSRDRKGACMRFTPRVFISTPVFGET
jgi:hypothetical protein